MKITKKYVFSLVLWSVFALSIFSLTTTANPAQADETLFNSQIGINGANELGQVYGNQKIDLRILVGRIINVVLGLLAVIFLALIIFAGFRYMTAGGNEEQTKKAVSLLKNAIIGLLIVLMAWAITRFTVLMLGRAVNGDSGYLFYSSY
ncbi:MAG: pilin [Patescibacteria group bacterium]|jgi:hypothetical protein